MIAIDHTRGNQVSLKWLLHDGHGNRVRWLLSDYTLSAFQWRGVWGEVQSSLGAGREYCANLGHPEDETGLVYMRARYYEPATGRFISEDPARDGVNWYLYADGNLVGKVDGDGCQAWFDAFLAWISRTLLPIAERFGQLGLGPLLEVTLLPIRVATGNLLVNAVFESARLMERLAFSLMRGGVQDIAIGAQWLQFARIGGSLGQSITSGYLGVRSILGGAAEFALGVSLLVASRVVFGIALSLEVD
ncbi:MAG: hypothetical protein KatS3mg017_0386 [Fimbriimonadales bacterium]|nr:MAG: hypothetical protein KatS3mg017_0386 [Fimbriimonadales bacterium]